MLLLLLLLFFCFAIVLCSSDCTHVSTNDFKRQHFFCIRCCRQMMCHAIKKREKKMTYHQFPYRNKSTQDVRSRQDFFFDFCFFHNSYIFAFALCILNRTQDSIETSRDNFCIRRRRPMSWHAIREISI